MAVGPGLSSRSGRSACGTSQTLLSALGTGGLGVPALGAHAGMGLSSVQVAGSAQLCLQHQHEASSLSGARGAFDSGTPLGLGCSELFSASCNLCSHPIGTILAHGEVP